MSTKLKINEELDRLYYQFTCTKKKLITFEYSLKNITIKKISCFWNSIGFKIHLQLFES